ncbi:MAG: anti-sigma factor [Gammaproteobacteria bacterium]|uniref:anti-sigma factor family protein n=1 Tax=Rhodoferax sp. TaxID=50421 RepID=UPI0017B24651|nr:anti-sigma factor [Rhodoferax sp.]MBU3899721.1 anti-sigma factor [Gammaproteobacteria bacterium]MBA3056757.1 anti-sigma factor [Rhodoferax sp.]MBU3996288.1 anti-sigma factor [Gammaproteobacteria bacterium]MBU4018197.1 anti-sigma factor [Gammaproteobacteria bacterium]MBU4080112.1 anti-sigma factor [Gammaproteobacteria bacterium]
MDRTAQQPLTEDEIHALVDERLTPDALAAVHKRLAHDPAAQSTIAQWQQHRDALRRLHQHILDEPVPAPLMAAGQQTAAAQQDIHQRWRWGGMAAGVMLAFGVGWFSHTAWLGAGHFPPSSSTLAYTGGAPEFARQASFAHAVYAPEIRHPVEVGATEQEHLVQWLSKRVGKPLKVPHLQTQGFELVGGRLLPGEAGARAQFMYQNTAGTRITLYLGAVDRTAIGAGAGVGADIRETGFQFRADGPVPSFYWVDQGFGYALAGPVPRETLMKLAEAVYRQL